MSSALAGISPVFAGISSYMGTMSQNAQISASNIIGKGQTRIQNEILRPSQNEKTSAFGALSRWTQAENNKRVLDTGAARLAAGTTNALRVHDQMTNGSLSEQITAAEQAGAAAAMQAFNGVFGGVADTVNATTTLRRDIGRTIAYKTGLSMKHDNAVMAGQLFSQMVGGLSNNLLLDVMDYSINQFTEQKQGNPYTGAVLAAANKAVEMGLKATMGAASGGAPTMAEPTGFSTSMSATEGMAAYNSYLTGDTTLTLGSGQAFFQPSQNFNPLSIGQ